MKASAIPSYKFPVPFGNKAGASYIRQIPVASQIGITDGAASLTDGFPPICFQPVGGGGIPPFGQDINGLLEATTAWTAWANAGGVALPYDPTFSAAIGGYPSGAFVASATTAKTYWLSTADNNTSNPDAGGAGWLICYLDLASILSYVQTSFQTTNIFTQISSTDLVGMSLAQTGDFSIPRGMLTTIPLSAITVNSGFGSVSNGVLTVVKAGYYIFSLAATIFLSTSHASDAALLQFSVMAGGGGNPLGGYYATPPGGGQTNAGFYTSFTTHLNAGDQVKLQAIGNNPAYNDATNIGVAGYTNLTVAFLNA